MENKQHEFYKTATATTETVMHIIDCLGQARRSCYGHGEFELLGEMLHEIKSAIFLRKQEALDEFVSSTKSQVKVLRKRLEAEDDGSKASTLFSSVVLMKKIYLETECRKTREEFQYYVWEFPNGAIYDDHYCAEGGELGSFVSSIHSYECDNDEDLQDWWYTGESKELSLDEVRELIALSIEDDQDIPANVIKSSDFKTYCWESQDD